MIFAGVNGYLDKFPLDSVQRFEHGFLAEIKANHQDVLAGIRESQELSDELRKKLTETLDGYAAAFAA